MVAKARRKLKARSRSRRAVFHCTLRCVRRAFLCGQDPVSGNDYSHRRDWILIREEQLAGLFAIEVEFRCEMQNHLHVMLRTCPEIARRLSDEEVARRWLTITKLAKCKSDAMPVPDPKRVEELVKDKKRIKKLRRRLTDISWFMGILAENIARRANAEDGCRGRFWESRFKCRECADDGAVLVCGVYVDLNAQRAGEVDSPEQARYTSVFQRLMARSRPADALDRPDGWMAELTLAPESKATESLAYSSRTGRRATDMGILPITLDVYVQLLKTTGEMLRSGERTTIPKDLVALLDRMEVNPEAWVETVEGYDELFGDVVGSASSIKQAAEEMGVSRLKGTAAGGRVFRECSGAAADAA